LLLMESILMVSIFLVLASSSDIQKDKPGCLIYQALAVCTMPSQRVSKMGGADASGEIQAGGNRIKYSFD